MLSERSDDRLALRSVLNKLSSKEDGRDQQIDIKMAKETQKNEDY